MNSLWRRGEVRTHPDRRVPPRDRGYQVSPGKEHRHGYAFNPDYS